MLIKELKQIIKDMYEEMKLQEEGIEDKNKMKALFLMGGGGSGKSTIGNEIRKQGDSLGIKVINSDDMFEYLLNKNDLPFNIDAKNRVVYNKQMEQREKAKRSTILKRENVIDSMLPLIIDGTGANYEKIQELRDYLEGIGYDTAAVAVLVELETALARNKNRPRKVDEDIIKEDHRDLRSHLNKYQKLFGTPNFKIVNNDDGYDIKSESAQEDFNSIYNDYFASPLKNRKGQEIIQKLKEQGGKYLTDLKPEDE